MVFINWDDVVQQQLGGDSGGTNDDLDDLNNDTTESSYDDDSSIIQTMNINVISSTICRRQVIKKNGEIVSINNEQPQRKKKKKKKIQHHHNSSSSNDSTKQQYQQLDVDNTTITTYDLDNNSNNNSNCNNSNNSDSSSSDGSPPPVLLVGSTIVLDPKLSQYRYKKMKENYTSNSASVVVGSSLSSLSSVKKRKKLSKSSSSGCCASKLAIEPCTKLGESSSSLLPIPEDPLLVSGDEEEDDVEEDDDVDVDDDEDEEHSSSTNSNGSDLCEEDTVFATNKSTHGTVSTADSSEEEEENKDSSSSSSSSLHQDQHEDNVDGDGVAGVSVSGTTTNNNDPNDFGFTYDESHEMMQNFRNRVRTTPPTTTTSGSDQPDHGSWTSSKNNDHPHERTYYNNNTNSSINNNSSSFGLIMSEDDDEEYEGPIDYDEELSKSTILLAYSNNNDDDDDVNSEAAYIHVEYGTATRDDRSVLTKTKKKKNGDGGTSTSRRGGLAICIALLGCLLILTAVVGIGWYVSQLIMTDDSADESNDGTTSTITTTTGDTETTTTPPVVVVEFDSLYIKAGLDRDSVYVEPTTAAGTMNRTWISDELFLPQDGAMPTTTAHYYNGCPKNDDDTTTMKTNDIILPASGNNNFPWDTVLYCSERWFTTNTSVVYEIPVVPIPVQAKYKIKLYFNELFYNADQQRIFDIVIEDNVIYKGFDIFKQAGYEQYSVVVVEHDAIVKDGYVSIELIHDTNAVKITAIVIDLVHTDESLTAWVLDSIVSHKPSPTKTTVHRFARVDAPLFPYTATTNNNRTTGTTTTMTQDSNTSFFSGIQSTNNDAKDSIFINAGGDESQLIISRTGELWTSDVPYLDDTRDTGSSYDQCPFVNATTNIEFNDDTHKRILCSMRVFYSTGQYEIPIPVLSNVTTHYNYTVSFVELVYNHVGDRIFTVQIEDSVVGKELDIYEEAGGQSLVYTLSGTIRVGDSSITIQLIPLVGSAIISAIEIHPVYNNTNA